MVVNYVYIHHEGAGAPSDTARGADGGYTYWLGANTWQWLRSAYDSYATKSYNGKSVDICLSGDRHTGYPVTDKDLGMIESICREAKSRGYLGSTPDIRPHRETSQTACPGDKTMSRWGDVEAAAWRGTGGSGGSSGGGSTAPPKPGTAAPPFPYPGDHFLGQPDPNPTCHSGYYGGVDTTNVRTWQQRMRDRGWNIGVDGKYGPQSQDVCRSFQQEKGLGVDGLCGPQTWGASWTAPIT